MSTLRPALVMALLGVGCAEYSIQRGGDSENDATAFDQDDTLSLRIDVYPSDDLAADRLDEGVALMAQSFRLEDEDLDALPILQLQAPVVFDGSVFGFEAYPTTAEVSVPGEASVAVEAEIQAYVPGTPMGRTAVSDPETGEFQLQLTPTDWAYQLAVVPRDPATLPFFVDPALLVAAGDDGPLDFDLDYGVPLYGRVTQGDAGTPLPGLSVRAVDSETGIGGPVVETASDGTYGLRVYPGSYWLQIEGDDGKHLPDRTLLAEVRDDEDGLRLDARYGAAAPITVLGEVQDEGGRALEDVQVRFSSRALLEDPGAEFMVAVTTGGGNGAFSVRLLPGTYDVEFIPPYGAGIGPMAWPESVELVESYTELNGTDPIVLGGRPVVEQVVLDSSGMPLADVIVRAQELGFDHYAYTAVTDAYGEFTLGVADGDLQWSFTPPQGSNGASTFVVADASGLQALAAVELSPGLTVAGCVQFEDVVASYMPLDVRDSDDRLYATSMTDIDGCFSVKVDWGQASPDEARDTGE